MIELGKGSVQKSGRPTHSPQWDNWAYRLGCPVWACDDWADSIYPAGTANAAYLTWYSYCFSTVEGNTTFYGVPPQSTFERWRDAVAETFQFCFKFPSEISHERQLLRSNDLLSTWLSRLSVVRDAGKLGPTFLQLAPNFSFRQFQALENFLRQLPQDWPWAVEVRHSDWYDQGDREARLDDLLATLSIDKVIFDSRPLHSSESDEDAEKQAQARKPKSPIRFTVTGKRPMVRLIGSNQLELNTPYLQEWSRVLVDWIRAGLEPWVFAHAPGYTLAPVIARQLHEGIRALETSVPELPTVQELVQKLQPDSNDRSVQLRLF